MRLEQQLQNDLRALVPDLAPPPDLAGTVLRDLHRQRRNRLLAATAVTAVAVTAVAAVVVGWSQLGSEDAPGSGLLPADPPPLTFPAPGGGRQAIHLYTTDDPTFRTFLLDPATGEYVEFPFEYATLSPDLSTVALVDEHGPGIADREALLRDGPAAIVRVDVPSGGPPAWAPDGSAVLFTSLEKTGTVRFTAHRYEPAAGTVTDTTPINVDLLGNAVGWAADSTRYLVPVRGEVGTDTVQPGPLQYVHPDGTLGERIEIEGGLVGRYSPSGDYLTVDTSGLMADPPVPSTVVELATGDVVLSRHAKPVGWYDDRTVVLLVSGTLELTDIATGEVTDRIDLAGLPHATALQLGSTDGLTGPAARRGF